MTLPSEAPMETLSEAVDRLTRAGYGDEFRALEEGGLRALGAGCTHPPEALVIEEIVRFEGTSDPEDESILFGLCCPEHGVKGTYAVVYGPGTEARDAAMVRRLHRAAER